MKVRCRISGLGSLCYTLLPLARMSIAGPWTQEVDQLPPLPTRVVFSHSVDRQAITAFEPLIVQVTLTNRDLAPLSLETRKDGAPFLLASLVARDTAPFERHHQWLLDSGPEYHDRKLEVTLKANESTSGQFLILFGGLPTGLAFSEPGQYRVKVGCQPDPRFAPIYSDETTLTVVPDSRGNAAFWRDLDGLAFEHFAYDRESVVRNYGAQYHVGIRLLQDCIAQNKPYWIADDGSAGAARKWKLVGALGELARRHANVTYSAYIQRYLGLVYLKTLEHTLSRDRPQNGTRADGGGKSVAKQALEQPSYELALGYLTAASNADLYPRPIATYWLGMLQVMTERWDAVERSCETLRTRYASAGGVDFATELSRQAEKYRRKVEGGY